MNTHDRHDALQMIFFHGTIAAMLMIGFVGTVAIELAGKFA
jgi:hypothetical protein